MAAAIPGSCLPAIVDQGSRLVLVLGFTCVIASTLAPFDFSASSSDLPERVREAVNVASSRGVLDLAGHFLAFLLLGGLFATVYERSIVRRGFKQTIAAAAVFSLLLELVQVLAESRHLRIADLLCNFAGLTTGIIACLRWRHIQPLRVTLHEHFSAHEIHAYLVFFLAGSAVWLGAGL